MVKNKKISPRQFKYLVILCFIGTSILFEPGVLAAESKQDGWIAAILGGLIGLLLVLLYISLGDKMGDLTLVQYSEKLLGKWIGKIVSLLYISFLFLNTASLIYVLGNFITNQMMQDTPIQALNIIFIIVIIIGTRLGLEIFARTSELLYPILIGIFVVFFILLARDIDFINIQPVFEEGIKPIIKGSIFYASYSSMTLIPLMMIFPSHVNNRAEAKKAFLSGTLISGILIFFITALCILILGHNSTAQSSFPTYVLSKRVNIGNFLERPESIITITWFITIFFKTILHFYGTVLGLGQTLKVKDNKILTIPLGIIVIVLSLVIYPNTVFATDWDSTTWIPFVYTFGLVLPLFLLIVGKFKKN